MKDHIDIDPEDLTPEERGAMVSHLTEIAERMPAFLPLLRLMLSMHDELGLDAPLPQTVYERDEIMERVYRRFGYAEAEPWRGE